MENSQFQEEVNTLKSDVLSLQESKNGLERQNIGLLGQLKALQIRIESLQKEVERDKGLLETRMRASELAKSVNYQSELDNLEMRVEKAKREVIGRVSSEFASLVRDERLNEENFGYLLKRIKEEFERLSLEDRNVRRLLGLRHGDSVEDELCRVLLRTPESNVFSSKL
jgi:chromosome segregation ATPase